MGQGSSPTAQGEGTTCHGEGGGGKLLLYIASPEMGNVNLKQWKGGCPGRIERQQGSITIKLSAGKNALQETGLSLWICMNWKGETA